MVGMFLLVSLVVAIMSFLSLDPMKSCLLMIVGVLVMSPLLSFMSSLWYSYFVSLLFLSGVFVILVYFSSISQVIDKDLKMYVLLGVVFMVSLWVVNYEVVEIKEASSLEVIYSDAYWAMVVWLVFLLVLFMNFVSYYLNFSGALRSV